MKVRRLVSVLVFSLLLMMAALVFMLSTNMGLTFTMRSLGWFSGETFRVGAAHGRLAGKWRLEDVVIKTTGATAELSLLAVDWRPSQLLSGHLDVDTILAREVHVVVKERKESGDGSSRQGRRPSAGGLNPPLAITVNTIAIEDLRIDDGAQSIAVHQASAALSLRREKLAVENFSWRADSHGGTFNGELDTTAEMAVSAHGTWWLNPEDFNRLNGTLTINGPTNNCRADLAILHPSRVDAQVKLFDPFSDFSWRLNLTAESFSPADLSPHWPASQVGMRISSEGTGEDFKGTVSATLTPPDLGDVDLTASFSGDSTSLVIGDATLHHGEGVVHVTAQTSLRQPIQWQSNLHIVDVEPSIFFAELPTAPIDAEISAHGELAEQKVSYTVDIESMEVHAPEPIATIQVNGHIVGDQSGLRLTGANLGAGTGVVEVDGSLQWTDGLSWQMNGAVRDFDPAITGFLPPGMIEASVSTSGSVAAASLQVDVGLDSLSGELAGYELTGSGKFSLTDTELIHAELMLANGDNTVTVSGAGAEEVDLDFSFHGTELHRIVPKLAGSLDISGALTGPRDDLRLTFSTSGEDIAMADFSLKQLSGSGDIGFGDRGLVRADITVDGLSTSMVQIDQANTTVDGTVTDHLINLDLVAGDGDIQLSGRGGLSADYEWNGDIDRAMLTHVRFGAWRLRDAARLTAGRKGGALDGFCMQSTAGGGCLTASIDENSAWRVALSEFVFNTEMLSQWGLSPVDTTAEVSGNGLVYGTGGVVSQLEAMLSAVQVRMSIEGIDGFDSFDFYAPRLSLSYADERIDTSFSSALTGGGAVEANLSLSGYSDADFNLVDMVADGRLRARLTDLSAIALLSDEFVIPSGTVDVDINVSGRLRDPILSGTLSLQNGELRFPELGSALHDLTGAINGNGKTFSINLSGRAGEGNLTALGSLDWSGEQWRFETQIGGNKALIVNRRDKRITAGPDLLLRMGPDGGDLTGRTVIDQALFSPEQMVGSVSPSADVVIVDEDKKNASWPFTYSIDVILGDQVQLTGYGLDVSLGGTMVVNSTSGKPVYGRGELNVTTGTFLIYGRPLDISRGRIFFNGGSVDNPLLDIRAEKSFAAREAGQKPITVGIAVSGFVHDYRVELFSSPAMEDSDIVSYLILDRPLGAGEGSSGIVASALERAGLGGGNRLLDQLTGILPDAQLYVSSGDGGDDRSVVILKQLTDNLSISYDFNLFTNDGLFNVSYNFGSGFSVQTSNSFETNLAELVYSFER
jgi:translocation and assembly module TamB